MGLSCLTHFDGVEVFVNRLLEVLYHYFVVQDGLFLVLIPLPKSLVPIQMKLNLFGGLLNFFDLLGDALQLLQPRINITLFKLHSHQLFDFLLSLNLLQKLKVALSELLLAFRCGLEDVDFYVDLVNLLITLQLILNSLLHFSFLPQLIGNFHKIYS